MSAWTVVLIGIILAAGLIRKSMNDSKEMEFMRLEWRASGGFHALIDVHSSHVRCSCGQVFASELSLHGAIAQWTQHVDAESLGG